MAQKPPAPPNQGRLFSAEETSPVYAEYKATKSRVLQSQQFNVETTFAEPGRVGERTHITLEEHGTLPTEALARMHGVMGERPGEHRNKSGEDWERFKKDVRLHGIKSPIFVTVNHGEEPQISEGNHRRDAALELGHPTVPVQIRYFGHAERQGSVLDRWRKGRAR